MARTPVSYAIVVAVGVVLLPAALFGQIAGVASPTPSATPLLGTMTPTGLVGGSATATITATPSGGAVTPTGSPAGTASATVTPTGGTATTATPSATGGTTGTPGVGTPTASPIVTGSAAVTRTPSAVTPGGSPTPNVSFEDDGCQVNGSAGAAWPLLLAPLALWIRRRRVPHRE